MAATSPETESPLPRWLYLVLTAAVVGAYWVPRLWQGFWVDETGTFWVVRKGFEKVWDQMQIYPGQSVIYAHLGSLFATDGPHKELLLRLPSVAGGLVAAWLIYRLAEEMIGAESGYLAAIPFCCAGAIVQTATYARPYAIGLAVTLASFRALRQWVHSGRTVPLVVYCICSSMVVYFHYLFGMVFLVQFLYLVAAWRVGRRFSIWKVVGAGLVILAAALPLTHQVMTIAGQANLWKTSVPTLGTFVSFFPLQTLTTALVGLVLFQFLYPQWLRNLRGIASDDLLFLIAWLLVGPFVVFVVARMTGYAVFNTRYMIYALPPAFILMAWGIRQVGKEHARFALLLAMGINGALYLPALRESEWRTPLELVRQTAGEDTPLIVRSGFVESANFDLTGEPKGSSYLFAPLAAYPMRNEIIPAPFFMNAAAEQTLKDAVTLRAPKHRRFVLMATSGSDVLDRLPGWFESLGYKASARDISGFTIIRFER